LGRTATCDPRARDSVKVLSRTLDVGLTSEIRLPSVVFDPVGAIISVRAKTIPLTGSVPTRRTVATPFSAPRTTMLLHHCRQLQLRWNLPLHHRVPRGVDVTHAQKSGTPLRKGTPAAAVFPSFEIRTLPPSRMLESTMGPSTKKVPAVS
jgi:hypothetical protein